MNEPWKKRTLLLWVDVDRVKEEVVEIVGRIFEFALNQFCTAFLPGIAVKQRSGLQRITVHKTDGMTHCASCINYSEK